MVNQALQEIVKKKENDLVMKKENNLLKRLSNFYAVHRHTIEGWGILTPVLLYFIIFVGLPFIMVFYLSFFQWNGITGNPAFIGIKNYFDIATQPHYLKAYKNTFLIGGIGHLIGMVLGFFIALLLNKKIKGRGFFRTIWY